MIQAKLGEASPSLDAAMVERRRSAPEWRPSQRCSSYLESLRCSGPANDIRFTVAQPRGASEPCSSRNYFLQAHKENPKIYKHKILNCQTDHYDLELSNRIDKNDVNNRYNCSWLDIEPIDGKRENESYQRNKKNFDRKNIADIARSSPNNGRDSRKEDSNERWCTRETPDFQMFQCECFRDRRNVDPLKHFNKEKHFDTLNKQNHERKPFSSSDQKEPYLEKMETSRHKNSPFYDTNNIDKYDKRRYDWNRFKEISQNDDSWKINGENYDPMDNYGSFERFAYGRDETADSDEFTYITIDSQTVAVPITICVIIMVVYIIFGAMLFGMWEDWDRVDGSYFCFISLTSIGFGDIVPGEQIYARATRYDSAKRIDTSFILCSIYLLFGMALIAMCFNLMQEQVIQYMAGAKRVLRRMFRCKR